MTDKIVVLSTCAKGADAEKVARGLVTLQLAACVSVAPEVSALAIVEGTDNYLNWLEMNLRGGKRE